MELYEHEERYEDELDLHEQNELDRDRRAGEFEWEWDPDQDEVQDNDLERLLLIIDDLRAQLTEAERERDEWRKLVEGQRRTQTDWRAI